MTIEEYKELVEKQQAKIEELEYELEVQYDEKARLERNIDSLVDKLDDIRNIIR